MKHIFLSLLICATLLPLPVAAGGSEPFVSEAVEAKLVAAQNGVAPGVGNISAGLHLKLAEGWKTYWRTPGEVGIPPTIDWAGSENVADVDFLWPAPVRFRAFGIENFGYKGEVLFPLNVTLEDPGKPVRLQGQVRMLICSIVCVPLDFTLALELSQGSGIDAGAAELIADWSARVPDDGLRSGLMIETAALTEENGEALVVTVRSSTPFKSPEVFPEMSEKTTFGPPDIRLDESGRLLWARIPVTARGDDAGDLDLTVTDGPRAATMSALTLSDNPAPPPFARTFAAPTLWQLLRMAVIALLGGLILNVMPCVLPVLSIKFTSAMKAQGQSAARIRAGFLVSVAGVMVFMWGLAAATLGARALGLTIGWGLQFQNPVFLAAMTAILFLFAANLFGLYDFRLPERLTTRLARASGQPTLAGDFATGAFAAVLATPCSAPFLGTAVAFALAGRPVDIFVIFSALGLGLAFPYLLVAAQPGLVRRLPKPGRWMLWAKVFLGMLLAVTAFWLLWVLDGVAGLQVALGVAGFIILATALLAMKLPRKSVIRALRPTLVASLIVGALVFPLIRGGDDPALEDTGIASGKIAWVAFERASISRRVSEGRVVFVDVTADWCLTCKANKALVIERGEVARVLNAGEVIPMQADWTRPNDMIARFLEANGRYGIPFNAVYGPKAPDGILLPEILSQDLVLDAITRAGGQDPAVR